MRPGRWLRGILAALALLSGAGAAFFVEAAETRWLFVALSLLCIGSAFALSLRGGIPAAAVFVGAVFLRAVWLPVDPVLTDDVYRYIWDGRATIQGINPYLHTPESAEAAPLRDGFPFAALNSAGYYSVYPPVSQVVFAAAALGGKGQWPASYLILKLLLGVADLVAVALLLRFTPVRLALLYAWHPLAVVASSGQGHSEALAVPLLIASVLFVRSRSDSLGAAFLAAAAWVKLVPFFAFPYFAARGKWRALAAGGAVAALLAAPFWAPSVISKVLSSLDLYVRLFEFNAGPYYLLKRILFAYDGQDWSKQLGPFLRGLFLAASLLAWGAAWVRRWPYERFLFVIYGLFILTATTVHPWYLTPLLALLPLMGRRGGGWHWLAACSIGTYLFYVGGPYWLWVWVGWSGLAIAGLIRLAPSGIAGILEKRAADKADLVGAALRGLPTGRILDIGAAEGYVSRELARRLPSEVVALDLISPARTVFPVSVYAGDRIPYSDNAFDASVLIFVLHHATSPGALLKEAVRVTRGSVVILESVLATPTDRWLLPILDRLANGLRALVAGRRPGGEPLQFGSPADWRALVADCGCTVDYEEIRYGAFHKRHLFRVRPGRPA